MARGLGSSARQNSGAAVPVVGRRAAAGVVAVVVLAEPLDVDAGASRAEVLPAAPAEASLVGELQVGRPRVVAVCQTTGDGQVALVQVGDGTRCRRRHEPEARGCQNGHQPTCDFLIHVNLPSVGIK